MEHLPELLACSKRRAFFVVTPHLGHSRFLGRCALDICCSSYPYGNCWFARSLCDPTLVGRHPLNRASPQGRHHFGPGVHRYEILIIFNPHCIHTPGLVALTVSIDSYFWDHWPLWPEFSSIYFNVYEGKSAEWGVSILFCCNILLLIPCTAGIPILDLLFNIPSAPSHGHKCIHRIRFLSRPPYSITCSASDRLCLPHELHWAQRMAFHRVCRTNVEYCCRAWCPGRVRSFLPADQNG